MFVVAMLAMKDAELNRVHRPAHLDYLAGLKAEGKVWASGPLGDGKGGLVVYEVADMAAARALAEADPLVTSGARELSLYAWDVGRPVRALAPEPTAP